MKRLEELLKKVGKHDPLKSEQCLPGFIKAREKFDEQMNDLDKAILEIGEKILPKKANGKHR